MPYPPVVLDGAHRLNCDVDGEKSGDPGFEDPRQRVETGPAEMSFYANQNYGQPTAHLRRYSLRTDGFVALHAGYDGGEMISRPFQFGGKQLEINFATSAAGSVKVELQDAAGKPIESFALADCQEQIGNEIDRVVSWKKGSDVSSLAGKPVRLRLVLKDADVFSLRFRP